MGITDKEELERALHQLNSNLQKLAGVFQHNQKVFTGGFELVEMHHFVARRVMNDLFLNRVRFTEPRLEEGQTAEDVFSYKDGRLPVRNPISKIDWDWYYEEFKRCVKDDVAKGVLEFCDITLKAEEPKAEEPAAEEAQVPPEATENADFVFGGDYAGQQVG